MHYFENETIMSIENALALKPNEISILEHVRTYEYRGEGDGLLPYFLEVRCLNEGVVVRKNKILDFPQFQVEKEQLFENVEEATEIFHQWLTDIQGEG